MAEGGLLAWKVQKVTSRGPTAEYTKEALTLPDPPEGMEWKKDDNTREWTIVPTAKGTDNQPAPNNVVVQLRGDDDAVVPSTIPENANIKDTNGDTDVVAATAAETGPREGLDYIEHVVVPTDTLQGLCIRYKVTAAKIRQANQFTGMNLLLAPSRLLIPLSEKHVVSGRIKVQDRNSREFKVHAFLDKVIGLSLVEANAYLDMNDGNVEEAICNALEDKEWEKQQEGDSNGFDRKVLNYHDQKLSNNSVHEAVPVKIQTDDVALRELELQTFLIPRVK
mmetsp:Transcript_33021/g.40539  ORF Transcript_33021/g.40539 Transcript_33021/m.40539 type:complete len:279 (-) Transcript_33021:249-1085(-)|eukprot:CAMPEP_0172481496 /NCGR_PEP_ID=MMETSP1066-20121228/7384_1 /TAXON_ID=671091 /ORGANISM="Coscinodiscus wailesii, Strain CCMP2513" /LENGTH=278 /DNA_ID=CAMNT_0013243815 /DNA_START=96 /DNA_END=932 /DNA_ORIENTATION=-